MIENPLVTVLMPVYNGGEYLDASIKSILEQTYSNLEFIIVDNASTDNSLKIIKKFQKQDKRIKLYMKASNQGVVSSLNLGLERATGEYLARMDCDDIAYASRVEEQVHFMFNNQELFVTSVWAKKIGDKQGDMITPTKHTEIKAFLMFGNPVIHSGVLMNLKNLRKHGLKYRSKCPLEDYELWNRVIEKGLIQVLPKILMKYRFRDNSMTAVSSSYTRSLLRVSIKDALCINFPFLLSFFNRSKWLIEMHSRFACKEKMSFTQYIVLPFWLLLICVMSFNRAVLKIVFKRAIAYCFTCYNRKLLTNPKVYYQNYNEISHLSF